MEGVSRLVYVPENNRNLSYFEPDFVKAHNLLLGPLEHFLLGIKNVTYPGEDIVLGFSFVNYNVRHLDCPEYNLSSKCSPIIYPNYDEKVEYLNQNVIFAEPDFDDPFIIFDCFGQGWKPKIIFFSQNPFSDNLKYGNLDFLKEFSKSEISSYLYYELTGSYAK